MRHRLEKERQSSFGASYHTYLATRLRDGMSTDIRESPRGEDLV